MRAKMPRMKDVLAGVGDFLTETAASNPAWIERDPHVRAGVRRANARRAADRRSQRWAAGDAREAAIRAFICHLSVAALFVNVLASFLFWIGATNRPALAVGLLAVFVAAPWFVDLSDRLAKRKARLAYRRTRKPDLQARRN